MTDETVVFPKIKTNAADKKDGDKKIPAAEKQTIVDKVSYTNLIIGKKYKVSGKLMNKETGKPVLDNGKEVTAEKEFTAETSNGFVNLEFTFNASALAGKTVVVFEDVYEDGKLIGTHSDINDEGQSVKIIKKGKIIVEFNGGNTNTGDKSNIMLYVYLLMICSSLTYVYVKKRRNQNVGSKNNRV